jgi:hypothetical protein
MLDQGISLLQNIDKYQQAADLAGKQHIVSSIFPKSWFLKKQLSNHHRREAKVSILLTFLFCAPKWNIIEPIARDFEAAGFLIRAFSMKVLELYLNGR